MKYCYGCIYLSDRAKLREFKNYKSLLCLYYLMIKFESFLAINNNDNKNNTATYDTKIRLALAMPIVLWLYSSDLKKGY